MGSFANTLFTIMLGWIQTAASAIWSAFTTENGGSFLQWIGRNWIVLAAVLCAAGLILDLGIYLLRWRPIKVWKSYFNRLRHRKEEPEETEEPERETEAPVPSGRLFGNREEYAQVAGHPPVAADDEREDLARWKEEPPAQEPDAVPAGKKQIITGAGYIVPEDSPYRRPSETAAAVVPAVSVPEQPQAEELEDRSDVMTRKKRRRRLIVSDLFNDPEEELYQYEAPQQLIDRNKAYRQPVYPRNWNKGEGEHE